MFCVSNAVRQHLAALENDSLVEKGVTRLSGGGQLYALTDKGNECFSRHYSWFARLLVESIQEEGGTGGVGEPLSLATMFYLNPAGKADGLAGWGFLGFIRLCCKEALM